MSVQMFFELCLVLAVILMFFSMGKMSRRTQKDAREIDALKKEIYEVWKKGQRVTVRLFGFNFNGYEDGRGGMWITSVLVAPNDSGTCSFIKPCDPEDRKINYLRNGSTPKEILGAPDWQRVKTTPYVVILGETYKATLPRE